ncbi:MAG: thioredoxin-dependent thiol peroxidase [Chthonomonas sp.]|nr:thioredoxin-dependent thiol peroxidase [Chthonomonas sp.]
MLNVGDSFPDFELSDQDGRIWTKTDLLGSPTVVFFYPKDNTPGCTKEACDLRDRMPKFAGTKIFGVSPDSVKSHKKFADKFKLEFPLLADTSKALSEACGVWGEKSLYGRIFMGVQRTTFLLDSEGKILLVWNKVKVPGHADDILSKLA